MAYSEADFERMKTDPTLQRQYFWQVGQKAIIRAKSGKSDNPQVDREFGEYIMRNLDRLVDSREAD